MDVGKLPNYVNTILCIFFFVHIFSLFLHLTDLRISYLFLLERFPRHVVLLLIKFQVMPRIPSFFTICYKLVYCDWSNIIFIIAHH